MKLGIRLALLLCAALPVAAFAQTPECPCPVPPAGPPPPWSGSAEFSFLSTSGNTDTSSIGGALELDYKSLPWTVVLKAAYLSSSTDGITTSEATTASLKGARDLNEHLDVYASAGYLRNTFAGIDSLVNGEAGVGYKLLKGPSQFLRPEIGFGYTTESETNGLDRNYASARAGLAYKWQFSKSAFFTNDFSFLYDLSDSDNWIIAEKAAITASLTSIFALKASWTLLYTNKPVLGFSPTNTATAIGLVAKF